MNDDAVTALLAILTRPKPPPLRPHIREDPPVVIGDPPVDRPDPRIGKIADYFRREALRQGKNPAEAASIARSQALNYIHELGWFKPIPTHREY